MASAIFVGNGLNRCYPVLHSWGGMLDSLAERLGVTGKSNASFSMEFERIANAALKSRCFTGDRAFWQMKSDIVGPMLDPQKKPQLLQKRLMDLPVQEILTTNYDYMLEYAADPHFFEHGVKSGSAEIR